MNAITYQQYGSPEVMEYTDVAKPEPAANEVLVKVKSASVNPLDWHIMRGKPMFIRFEFGLTKPKHGQLGADLSGVVEAIGADITRFRVGDEVFGEMSSTKLGALGEYAAVAENDLVLKPDNISFEEAAAVPVAALTALQGLRDAGNIQAGQSVLINGASGGVGTFAVQIAKSFGAHVTGVCSTRNQELIKSIGADQGIDYTKEDFTTLGEQYDLIIDAVGNRSAGELKRALKPGGRCVLAGYQSLPKLFGQMVGGLFISKTTDKWIGMMGTAQMDIEDLSYIAKLLKNGKIRSVIDRTYPLEKADQAIDYLEQGHARGKVVIEIA